MKLLLSIFLLLCAWGASAQTTIYYNRCDTGAHANCSSITGTDGPNPGTSPSSPRLTLPSNDAMNALTGGSIVRLCNGSSWVDGNVPGWLLQNSNATRTARITVENYDCGNGATGRPILQYSSGSSSGIVFGGFFNTTPHGGYVIRGVRITKSGSPGGTGLTFYGYTQWTLIEDVRVDNWANGYEVHTGSNIRNLTIRGTTACNPADTGLTACASSIDSNCQNGLLGSATDFLVERVLFQDNNPASGSCGSFLLQHGSYVGGIEPQSRITFRQNIYRNNSLTSGVCGSGNMTFRGMVDQLTVEENLIQTPGGNSQCIGLSIQDGYGSNEECVRRLVVRGNKIVDSGSSGFLGRITPGAIVENNEVYAFNTTTAMTGINLANPGSSQDLAVCPLADTIVRNNSGYYASGTSGQFVSVNAGSGHTVQNNLAKIASGSSANCFAHAGGTFTLWDYNWCDEAGSGQWSATYATRATACSGASLDCNGGTADAQLASTPSSSNTVIELSSSSPLRSAGRNTGKAFRDLLWCQRDDTPDIGAHEYGASTCLTFRAPVELR